MGKEMECNRSSRCVSKRLEAPCPHTRRPAPPARSRRRNGGTRETLHRAGSPRHTYSANLGMRKAKIVIRRSSCDPLPRRDSPSLSHRACDKHEETDGKHPAARGPARQPLFAIQGRTASCRGRQRSRPPAPAHRRSPVPRFHPRGAPGSRPPPSPSTAGGR